MKIAVLGATGPTGQQVVTQALNRGHQVIALVRNPSGVTTNHENLQVHKVNILEAGTMQEVMTGSDAVISCLGSSVSFFSQVTLYSDSMKAVVAAMRAAQVLRLVVITSWCTVYKPEHPKLIEWLMKPLLIGRQLDDMGRMEDFLAAQDDVIYTVVRPPGLSNAQLQESELLVEEGQFLKEARYMIPRANVAKFMLDSLDTDTWQRKMVSIGLK